MDTKYSLIKACKENPEDDAPRLILADWLDEYGDSPERDRAEFLRLFCQRGHLGRHHPDEAKILARIHELLLWNRQHWLDPILKMLHPCSLYFRNGFPVAGVNAIDNKMPWLKKLPADLSTDPIFAWLEGLHLITWRPDDLSFLAAFSDRRTDSLGFLNIDNLLWTGAQWNALTKAKPRLRLHSARVYGHPGDDYGRALATCPIFEGVRALNMQSGYPQMDDAALKELAKAPWLSSITHLGLAGNLIGPAGLRALVTSVHLGSLRKLNLACDPIGNEGAALLAQCSHLKSLTYLDLRRTGIDAVGVRALANSRYLRQLTFLSLAENKLDDDGAKSLASSGILANVQSLSPGTLTDAAAKTLAGSPHLCSVQTLHLSLAAEAKETLGFFGRSSALPQLRYLTVSGNTISQEAFEGLTRGQGFGKLESLELSFLTLGPNYCTANPERIRLFSEPECLQSLRSLTLSVPDYDLENLGEVIGKSAMFRRLRRLELSWAYDWKESVVEGICRLIDDGNLEDLSLPAPPEKFMKRLAACTGLQRLIRVRLWSTGGLRQRSLKTLLTSPHLSRLAMLDLSECRLGDAAKVLLHAGLPQLRWLNVGEGAEQDEILQTFARARPDVWLPGFRFHSPWNLDPIESVL